MNPLIVLALALAVVYMALLIAALVLSIQASRSHRDTTEAARRVVDAAEDLRCTLRERPALGPGTPAGWAENPLHRETEAPPSERGSSGQPASGWVDLVHRLRDGRMVTFEAPEDEP